jgi:3-isopropylmalate dehydrogenase
MKKKIAVLPGDGVGPEVAEQAKKVLQIVARKFGHDFTFETGLIGAAAIDATGNPYPDETHKLCMQSDAILFGAIGDPKYDNDPKALVRPEQGLLKMRQSLGLYANVRPIYTFEKLISSSPLKEEIIKGTNFVVIRELIGGIYFGKRGRNNDNSSAFDTSEYSKNEIERVATYAFELTHKRKKKLTVVDKANVLETSRLWRETIQTMEKEYPDVAINYMFVDNASMQIIKRPSEFDVIVTENMFGDILTDEASVITGSLGMLPSASIGEKTAIFEPIHGSYPKAAGQNTANPIGAILSAAMMLEYSFHLKKESDAIYQAVEKMINQGFGTKDLNLKTTLGTKEMGEKIIASVQTLS